MEIKKRETLLQNIAMMAIMAAVNVVFVLLSTLVPFLMFLILFALPLNSTMVTLICKKKYYLIYAVSSVLLCFLVTLWKIDNTIFYVIPAIITGFVFGLMLEKGVSAPWTILINTLLQYGLNFLSVPVIQVMFNRNIIVDTTTIFKVNELPHVEVLVAVIVLFVSFVQMFLSYMVTKDEVRKLGYKFKEFNGKHISYYLGLFTSLTITLITSFIYPPVAYVFSLVSLYFASLISVPLMLEKKKWIYASYIAIAVVTFFLVGALYTYIPAPNAFLVVNVLFIGVAIIGLLNNYLLIRTRKDTI